MELGESYGLHLDPGQRVEALSVGERQRVEIIKVLYRGAKILILDEPTAVLVPQEVDELFDSIRELTKEGQTVVFISHKLDEVLSIADRITVMRGGRTVGTTTPAEVDAGELAEMMIGSELPSPGDEGVDGPGRGAATGHRPWVAFRGRARICSMGSASRFTRERSSVWPVSRATGKDPWSTRSSASPRAATGEIDTGR